MSMFNMLASQQDLAEYMGVEETDLPKRSDILLKRASEIITIAMRNNFVSDNKEHIEAAMLATCAQCQNWIENELSPVSDANVSSYSLGDLSVTYSDANKLSNKLCLSAVRYLNYKHLLYKGVGVKSCGCQDI